ncbi:hypothetical protein Ddye_032214 [Dipteronia dyeriana]|uniref:DUF4283 domain-containing protein n=1 Tax=Dipteronia dyeriana TaxID=168575 RepID=A0AAD9TKF9_9ROSI|nr:hypothetical protein Ddye_032214 [Dipteronia dyeriana]
MVYSNSKGCSLGNVLTTISSLGDQPVIVGGSTQLPVMNSNPLPMCGKSYADLLKTPQAYVQSFPLTFTPSKKGGSVSNRGMVLSSEERLGSLLTLRLSLVWVRFYYLSWEYWHPNIIFDLAKGIGISLRLDKATIDGDFVHYARVLLDIDMSTLLCSLVLLERDEFHSSFISVEYKNLPSFGSICSSFGHLPSSCRWNKSKVPAASVGKSSQSMAKVYIEDTTF